MKKAALVKILVIAIACLVLGCGKKEEAQDVEKTELETSEEKEVEKEEKTDYKTIGKESEDAYKLLLTNRTGGEITGFTIKASNSQEASQNLLDAGGKIEKEETVCVYYTPEKTDAEPETENQAQSTYDFSLSYEDGHVVEIVGLGLDDMEEAELCFEDEIGFVKYKKDGSGEEVSTKEMALALKAQKEAQEAAAAQAKKEEEEQAAAQAEAAAQASQQEYYEPDYSQYEQPAPSVDVTQTGEGCLTGPVTNPGYDPVGQTGEGCLTGPMMNPNYDPNSN